MDASNTSCCTHSCVPVLYCRYHLLQPEYVLSRLLALQRAYRLTVLLLLVDAEEVGGTAGGVERVVGKWA